MFSLADAVAAAMYINTVWRNSRARSTFLIAAAAAAAILKH